MRYIHTIFGVCFRSHNFWNVISCSFLVQWNLNITIRKITLWNKSIKLILETLQPQPWSHIDPIICFLCLYICHYIFPFDHLDIYFILFFSATLTNDKYKHPRDRLFGLDLIVLHFCCPSHCFVLQYFRPYKDALYITSSSPHKLE